MRFVMHNTIVCLLTFAMALRAECFQCPDHCFCYITGGLVKTDCIRINLINTFIGISYRTKILDLSHNFITILHGNEFLDANLRQLKDLRLSNNRLHKIDKFSFNGLYFLENLDLSSNSIEYLNPLTFKYNPLLKTLNVSLNPLSLKKDEPFLSPAPSLQILDVANCQLDFVNLQTFSDLKSLAVLNISQNRIRNLQFSEGLQSLKYLDASQNDMQCNDDTIIVLRSLIKKKIQFRDFCQVNEKLQMISEIKEKRVVEEVDFSHEVDYKVTEKVAQQRSLIDDLTRFFQAFFLLLRYIKIPSIYVIVCGAHLGIFIGSFSTYFCLKKSKKTLKEDHEKGRAVTETSRSENEESDHLTFALIPHGTPPSPYHSRFFPSSFSLSAT